MYRFIVTVIVLLMLGIASPHAETIYTWIDADGTQRFSNTPPPEGTQNVQVTNSPGETQTTPSDSSANRQAYEQMVRESKDEAQRLENERQAKAEATAVQKARLAEEKRQESIRVERQRLQAEIDALKARGLSRTFSQGMKDNLIKGVQDRIDWLEKDPEGYFRDKAKGSGQ